MHSQGGNVVVMTALSLLVLVAAVGVAVDSSRVALVKINQQNATDNAERSANNFCSNDVNAVKSKTAMQNCIRTQATKYYKANIVQNYMGASGNSNPTIVFDGNNVDISANATMQSVLVKQDVKKSGVIDKNDDGIDDNTNKALTGSDYTSQAITVNIKTDASNTSWNGKCATDVTDKTPDNEKCIIGSYEAIPNTQASWYCKGINGGYNATCTSPKGVCGTPLASQIDSGACVSGTVANFVISSDNSQYSTSWTCVGANGGPSSELCKASFCNAGSPTSQTCSQAYGVSYGIAAGYSDPGVIKTPYCDKNAILQSSIVNHCASLSLCNPYDKVVKSSCPPHYSGQLVTTNYYICESTDPNLASSYKPATLDVNKTFVDKTGCTKDLETCVPSSDTQDCGTGFTGTKTRTSTCPDPYGQPVWSNFDISQCKALPICTPRTDTRTILCPAGQYGSKGQDQSDSYTCAGKYGIPVEQGWVTTSSDCKVCGDIPVGIWARPNNSWNWGFSFDSQPYSPSSLPRKTVTLNRGGDNNQVINLDIYWLFGLSVQSIKGGHWLTLLVTTHIFL